MSYKSSEGRDTGKLTQVFRSVKTVLSKGAGQGGVGIATLPITATGGNTILTPGDGWKYHIFTSPGTFSVTAAGDGFVELIMSGGGGGGGAGDTGGTPGSGGGGGGVIYKKNISISAFPGTYPITVGTGGNGGAGGSPPQGNPGTAGNSSIGFGLTAYGGGGGGNSAGGGGTSGPGGDTTNPRYSNQESPPLGWGWDGRPGGLGGPGSGGGAGGTSTNSAYGLVIADFYLSEGGIRFAGATGGQYSGGHGGRAGWAPSGSGAAGSSGIVIVRYKNV